MNASSATWFLPLLAVLPTTGWVLIPDSAVNPATDEDEVYHRAAEVKIRTEFRNGIPVQMKVQEFVETEEFRQTKRDLAALEEEFRRAGLPPGWARE